MEPFKDIETIKREDFNSSSLYSLREILVGFIFFWGVVVSLFHFKSPSPTSLFVLGPIAANLIVGFIRGKFIYPRMGNVNKEIKVFFDNESAIFGRLPNLVITILNIISILSIAFIFLYQITFMYEGLEISPIVMVLFIVFNCFIFWILGKRNRFIAYSYISVIVAAISIVWICFFAIDYRSILRINWFTIGVLLLSLGIARLVEFFRETRKRE